MPDTTQTTTTQGIDAILADYYKQPGVQAQINKLRKQFPQYKTREVAMAIIEQPKWGCTMEEALARVRKEVTEYEESLKDTSSGENTAEATSDAKDKGSTTSNANKADSEGSTPAQNSTGKLVRKDEGFLQYIPEQWQDAASKAEDEIRRKANEGVTGQVVNKAQDIAKGVGIGAGVLAVAGVLVVSGKKIAENSQARKELKKAVSEDPSVAKLPWRAKRVLTRAIGCGYVASDYVEFVQKSRLPLEEATEEFTRVTGEEIKLTKNGFIFDNVEYDWGVFDGN